MAPWLSQCNGVGVVMGTRISAMSFRSHKTSFSALVIATYSASVDDSVTMDCFFDPHAIGIPASDMTWPDIECR